MKTGIALIWNSLNSLLGILGGIGGVWQIHRRDSVMEISGGWLIRRLRRAGRAEAITLGDVILYAEPRLIPLLHSHEMVHVRQGRCWGPLFLPAYVLEALYQWLKTGDGYHHNRFERAAYGAEERVEE